MSLRELLKMLGLGAVALTLGVEGLDWLARRLWPRRGTKGPLKEVLFFPSPVTCVGHLYSPAKDFKWSEPVNLQVCQRAVTLYWLTELISTLISNLEQLPVYDPCPLPHGLDTSFSRLLAHLLSACVSLDLCVFSFSHAELSTAVQLLHSRGVAVRVLTDKDYMNITGSQIGALRRAGICVRHELSKVTYMHHKFALLDGRKLITGSFNWTATAAQSNRENVIVTDDPELVHPYLEEFHKLWEANDPSNRKRQTPNT